jgi:predicted acetyltransferase
MAQFYFSFGKKRPSERQTKFWAAVLWTILEPFIDWVLDFINRKILTKVDGRALKVVFDELDIFWLRNGAHEGYSESQIRLIIAMMVKSAMDGKLTRQELLAIVDFIQRKWMPQEALKKIFTQTDEVIEARVVATIDQAIELYEKQYEERPLTPEEFVAKSAEIIYHEPDGSEAQRLLGGMMQIKNKLIY